MEMDVFYGLRLVLEAGFEEIVDVGHLRIEQIEAFYAEPNPLGELVAHLAIEDGGCFGRDAIVLEQCTRTKMADPDAPEWPCRDPRRRIHRHATGNHTIERAGNVRLVFRYIAEARLRKRDVQVHGCPGVRIDVVC